MSTFNDRNTSDRLLTFVRLTSVKDNQGIAKITEEYSEQIKNVFGEEALVYIKKARDFYSKKTLLSSIENEFIASIVHIFNDVSSDNSSNSEIQYKLDEEIQRLQSDNPNILDDNDIEHIKLLPISSRTLKRDSFHFNGYANILDWNWEYLKVIKLEWFWEFALLTDTGEKKLAESGWYSKKHTNAIDDMLIHEYPTPGGNSEDQIKILVDGLELMSKTRFYELIDNITSALWNPISSNFAIDPEFKRQEFKNIIRSEWTLEENLLQIENKDLGKILIILSLILDGLPRLVDMSRPK